MSLVCKLIGSHIHRISHPGYNKRSVHLEICKLFFFFFFFFFFLVFIQAWFSYHELYKIPELEHSAYGSTIMSQ